MSRSYILIVDDSDLIRRELRLVLMGLGYEYIIEGESGSAALTAVESMEPDDTIKIIFCDYNMPGMNGAEFLRKLREQERWADTPCVALSTETDIKVVLEFVNQGANAYLNKPITKENIAEKIKEVMDLRAAGTPPPLDD